MRQRMVAIVLACTFAVIGNAQVLAQDVKQVERPRPSVAPSDRAEARTAPETKTAPEPEVDAGIAADAGIEAAPESTQVPENPTQTAAEEESDDSWVLGSLIVTFVLSTLAGGLLGAWLAVSYLRKRFREIQDQLARSHDQSGAMASAEASSANIYEGSGSLYPSGTLPPDGPHRGRRDIGRQRQEASDAYLPPARDDRNWLDDHGAADAPLARAPERQAAAPRPLAPQSQLQQVTAALAGLLAEQSVGRSQYESTLGAFGQLLDVISVRDSRVELSSGFGSGGQQWLTAVSIDRGETVVLVPSYDFFSDFRTVFRQTLDLPEIVKSAFRTEIDGTSTLKVSALAVVRPSSAGPVVTSQGNMSGFTA